MTDATAEYSPARTGTWWLAWLAAAVAPGITMLLYGLIWGAPGTLLRLTFMTTFVAGLPAAFMIAAMWFAERRRPRPVVWWGAAGTVAASLYALPVAYFVLTLPLDPSLPDHRVSAAIKMAAFVYGLGVLGGLAAWGVVRYLGRR